MASTSIHPLYEEASTEWRKARDTDAGQRLVHKAEERYLPRLTGQTNEEYAAYRKRTPFYNATHRTIDGLVGMVFRKPPVLINPPAMQGIVDDVSLSVDAPESATTIAMQTLREVLTVGRLGWLVEYPETGGELMTEAQAQARNLRPYATAYKTEQIIDWRSDRVNNTAQLVMVKLAETVTEWDAMQRRTDTEQERWLLLIDGIYIQRIYRAGAQFGDDIIPLMNGSPLSFIPFVGISAHGMALDGVWPPLIDLIDINLSHYRTCADLEHGAHFTGLPTPVVFGVQLETDQKLAIGSTSAWVFPNPDGEAKYLEFSGKGLDTLMSLRDAKQSQMAALGARMLADDKKQSEAAGTVRMRHAGESAVLATVANVVSAAMTRILQIMRDWSNITGDVSITLGTDYYEVGMTAQDLTALVGAWQAGAISHETMYFNLQAGEMAREGVSFEDEQAAIQNAPPSGGMSVA